MIFQYSSLATFFSSILSIILCLPLLARAHDAELHENNDSITNENSEYKRPKNFNSRGGLYNLSSISTSVRLDSAVGVVGSIIDLENDLGLSSSELVMQLDASYRFNHKHSLELSYFEVERSGIKILDKEIVFGDMLFDIDKTVETDLLDQLLEINYRYTLINEGRAEIYLGGDLRINHIDLQLVSIENTMDQEMGEIESIDTVFPIPLLVFSGRYYITPKISLASTVKQLLVQVSDIKGVLSDFELQFDYRLFDRYGIGLSFNKVNSDLESKISGSSGEYEITTTGIFAYITTQFY